MERKMNKVHLCYDNTEFSDSAFSASLGLHFKCLSLSECSRD